MHACAKQGKQQLSNSEDEERGRDNISLVRRALIDLASLILDNDGGERERVRFF